MDTIKIETDIFSDFGNITKNPEKIIKCENDVGLSSDREVKKEYVVDNNETFVGPAKFESKQTTPFNGRDFIDKLCNYDRECIFKSLAHERNEEIVAHHQNESLAIKVKQEIDFQGDTGNPILKEEIEFVDVQQNENTDDDSVYNEKILRINEEEDFKSCLEDSEVLLVSNITESKFSKKTKHTPRKISSRFNKYILNFSNIVSSEQNESAAANPTNPNTVCSYLDASMSPYFILQQQTSSSNEEPCDRTDHNEVDVDPFKCKLCDFRSYIELVVQRHMKAAHPKQKKLLTLRN